MAGKRAGLSKGENTRSGMLWEVERILDEIEELHKQGKSGKIGILMLENVPDLISSKFVKQYHLWEQKLTELGYTSFCGVLNSKNYLIPQNRRRVFVISILGDYSYDFPRKKPLKYKLKDFLEHEVDERYYLSQKVIEFFIANTEKQNENGNGFKFSPTGGDSVAKCITTKAGSRMDDNFVIDEEDEENFSLFVAKKYAERGDIPELYNPYNDSEIKDVAPTLTTKCGDVTSSAAVLVKEEGNKTIKIKNATQQGFLEAEEGDGVDISGRMQYHRGTVQKGLCQTITTMGGENIGVVVDGSIKKVGNYGNGHHAKDVFDTDGVAPTITTGNHGLGIAIVVEDERGDNDEEG